MRARADFATQCLESIGYIPPSWRRDLVAALGRDAAQVSIDTNYAHVATDAWQVDVFVTNAGETFGHVHLRDADGCAEHHRPLGHHTLDWHAVFRAKAALPHRPHLVLGLAGRADVPAAMTYLSWDALVG